MLVSPRTQLSNDMLIDADKTLFLLTSNFHFKFIDQFMIYLTLYGREIFWVVVILFLFIFGKEKGKKTALVILVSLIILVPIGLISKEIIERPRPIVSQTGFLIPTDSEYSFPSGHALVVSSGAAIALILFRGSSKELTVSIILTLESAFVCFSRVYVGSHYPLDVLSGILLGIGVSFILIYHEKKFERLYFLTIRIINKAIPKG